MEVEITPVVGTDREITTAVKEETRRNFLDIGALAEDIVKAKGRNRTRVVVAALLTTEAAIELYKTAPPFVSSGPNYPSPDQLINQLFEKGLESPIIVGLTAAIGAYYLIRRILDERKQINAASAGLHRASISPVNLRVSPLDVHENSNDKNESFH